MPEEKMVRLKFVVEIFDAKPNPMFTELQTAITKFLRFSAAVPCAECGRRSKHQWTLLCSFQAHSLGLLVPKKSGKIHQPLTAVCRSHILAAELEEVEDDLTPKPRKRTMKT